MNALRKAWMHALVRCHCCGRTLPVEDAWLEDHGWVCAACRRARSRP